MACHFAEGRGGMFCGEGVGGGAGGGCREQHAYCSLLHSSAQVPLRVDAHLVIPGTLQRHDDISTSSSCHARQKSSDFCPSTAHLS